MGPERKFSETSRNKNEAIPQGNFPSNLLFLTDSCEYSKEVWAIMKKKCSDNDLPNEWDLIIHELSIMPKSNNISKILIKLFLAATVYHIWTERNYRLFQDKSQDSKTVGRIICENTRLKLMSLRVKDTAATRRIAKEWDVKLNTHKEMCDHNGFA
ncbi:reverse transcriptase zinc-binding domain-containing protein [Artemisia annua]|uniref:Reverse transcriptase zinc-binding domain-containing protein n=1 Tax=Artemisia annua TaxID=35608 RepID=A0A2U1PNE9_ARTAN|nr:reverse transcriptase zinc-binding domain-containing protein [Artemisia annua]